METLWNMQVSFRVGLPDGAFAFDMAPVDTLGEAGLPLESGLKLHLRAIPDSGGVTLTLFISGQSNDRVDSDLETPEHVLGMDYAPNLSTLETGKNWLDFLEDGMFKPRALGYLPPSGFGPLNMSTDLPHDPTSFNDYFFDALDFRDSSENSFESDFGHGIRKDISTANTSCSDIDIAKADDFVQDFTLIPHSPGTDSDSTTPSTSSESHFALTPSPAPRSKLRCPEPSCARHFSSRYTLAKHMTGHAPKSEKFFVCTLGCTMRFSRKHDRLRHEVTQHGRICDWGCSACLKFFSSETTLKKHKCRNGGGARWISDQG